MNRTMDAAEELARTVSPFAEQRGHRRVYPPDRWLAAQVQQTIDPAAVRLELWDGSSTYAGSRAPIGDLVVRDRRTLAGLAVNPDLWFGEAYMAGRLEVRGPLEPVVEALSGLTSGGPSWRDRVRLALAGANSLRDSRKNVHHHYDLGNAFYQLWLDRELVYTCAYFAEPQMSLDDAQIAKLDLVCRKLRLRPGDTVVEAGCGWGALALHMARRYGARVKAFNVSREQLEYARSRASREGLAGQVEFIDDDYRNVSGQFDAFVSVGMLEHVGLKHFHSVADVLRRTIRPDGGRGFLHFIGRDIARPLNAWIARRIFPGAYTPTLAEVTTGILAPAGMSTIDVENLRLHYARTLACWSERFAAAREQVRATYGATFERAWELYLAGSQAAFATSSMQLFQVLFVPSRSAPPALTRADIYEAGGTAT
ncbi:MAG TPA: cyclopropane-fatty-acyl-phospholipid synthase family protein [Vicinamibacterales bacterium]|nr:cyclopropane-fatty-acyl-phospholipid synthase family protein [Vicinamibacterales bacterium]